jgi:hypothetical protein
MKQFSNAIKKEKNLFEAVMTVTKSTRHNIDETEKVRRSMYRYFNQLGKVVFVTVFQPLIVFTGRMYSTSEDESNLKPIKYAQLKKRYESANYNETLGTIHIVQYGALNEYIQLLHKYYWSKSNFIIQHQEEILSLVKESLVRWKDFKPF